MAKMAQPLITIAAARQKVLATVAPLPVQTVAIEQAMDRVLAADLHAAGNVPVFASSAMDGYAVKAGPAGRTLTVAGESRAGRPATLALGEGDAVRISTGAAMPEGAEAVIPQEDVDPGEATITTTADVTPGLHIRHPGEDMRAGTTVLRSGTVLGGAELGAAVAAGAGQVSVHRPPRVTVLCTGDELRAPGEPLGPGEIHNSNGPMLVALAAHAGALTASAHRIPDDRKATEAMLGQALDDADVVLISGGVSVGPHDHVKPALTARGVAQVFWRVALQPGKPTWFGHRGDQLVFGLPGNPVSAAVTFSLFVAPALARLQGLTPAAPEVAAAVLGADVARNPDREQALRVRLQRDGDKAIATPNGDQGSHVLSSLLGADALALIAPGPGIVAAGATVALERLAR